MGGDLSSHTCLPAMHDMVEEGEAVLEKLVWKSGGNDLNSQTVVERPAACKELGPSTVVRSSEKPLVTGG